jgi:methionine-rich copper-binding protein CopC
MKILLMRSLMICLVVASSASAALAHCFLDHSVPSSAAVLDSPPSQVVLYFDNQFNPSGTAVRVLDRKGDLVSGRATAGPHNRTLSAPLTASASGQYFVKWHATSRDGDHTMGAYSFTVRGPH